MTTPTPDITGDARRAWRDSPQEHRDFIDGRTPEIAWQAGYACRLHDEQAVRVIGHMSGPDHYRAAEQLLHAPEGYRTAGTREQAQAQVHATLALVAASIHDARTYAEAEAERKAWDEATS